MKPNLTKPEVTTAESLPHEAVITTPNPQSKEETEWEARERLGAPPFDISNTDTVEKLLKKLRKPFDNEVHAIPYAGNLFEKQARTAYEAGYKRGQEDEAVDNQKEDLSGYVMGRASMKAEILNLLKEE